MNDTMIVALLSLVGTLVGSIGGILTANKLTLYRIGELEKKVDKHNGVVERMAIAERDLKTCFRLVDDANKEIDETRKELREVLKR